MACYTVICIQNIIFIQNVPGARRINTYKGAEALNITPLSNKVS